MIHITCHICLEVGGDRSAAEGSYLCTICQVRTRLILGEIADLYHWISDPEYLANTREPVERWSKSRPPCSLHTISLTDPRSQYQRKGDPVSALRVLTAWRNAVGDMLSGQWQEIYDGTTVPVLVAELQSAFTWISAQPAVVRFARHMACVLHSLKQEVGSLKEDEDD